MGDNTSPRKINTYSVFNDSCLQPLNQGQLTMTQALTALEAQWIIQFTEPYVLENHTLIISDRKILDILPTEDSKSQYPAADRKPLPNHALIPGLINTHNHAAMTLF